MSKESLEQEKKGWFSFFRKKNTPAKSEVAQVESASDNEGLGTAQQADALASRNEESPAISENIAPLSEKEVTEKVAVANIDETEELVVNDAAVSDSADKVIAESFAAAEIATNADVAEKAIAKPDPEPIKKTPEVEIKSQGFLGKLKSKLLKTRENLTAGLSDLILGKKAIDDEVLEELETRLLMADVGVSATQKIIQRLTTAVTRDKLDDVNALLSALKSEMKTILAPVEQPLKIDTSKSPFIILMIGVNGVGKTTTIGKLAKQFQAQGHSVMLAAGDTFRAAAVEQLKVWGERNHVAVIAQKEGAEPASVIYDAIDAAKARKIDILIADTAGRLHTQNGLMQELAKIYRVIRKHDINAPHEVMLVVDASTGQNALNQAQEFNKIIPISGISLSKLDGTAKGGIILAIAEKMNIPIRYIGVGEGVDDLRLFKADDFIDALVDQ